MAAKVKIEKPAMEVTAARSRLDGILQHMVEQREDGAGDDGDKDESSGENKEVSPSAGSSGKRGGGGGKSSRKRRKKDLTSDLNSDSAHFPQHTYIMKLFDRSVDLAQFEESTPLYPICRAWMQNQPHRRVKVEPDSSPQPLPAEPTPGTSSEEGEDPDKPKEYFSLPAPAPGQEETTTDGEVQDRRVPSPVPQPDEELNIHADQEQAPIQETLLSNHLQRWKKVRQKWKETSGLNQGRYAESMTILKNMYDRTVR
ncbi:protein lin-37 homolog [Branchiostoma lanceolatum]|uniref:LIN37 protein n=2 Tax=Branchiostoma lanceolatum TaxID=7740 RepID=A0A8K0EWW3_BRALA|nr:LIN37 [Branchiostoma lanceolatum]